MPSKPSEPEQQWPPRSPHEALLSTPGGRERLRRLADRSPQSPSPSKARSSRAAGALSSRSANLLADGLDDEDGGDEDEETLQLKLQEIQAKLRLKKLQAARAQKQAGIGSEGEKESTSRPDSAPLHRRPQSRTTAPKPETITRPKSQNAIEVPASPVRRLPPTDQVQKSPSRVLLGIDKGLKAKDVSLKLAPSLRRARQERQERDGEQFGGYLQRTKTGDIGKHGVGDEKPRVSSFNDRLASARLEEEARRERQERIQNIRTTAFNVGRKEVDDYKARAVDIPDVPAKPPSYTRDEILGRGQARDNGLKRSNTVPSIRSRGDSKQDASGDERKETDVDAGGSFESYSGLHLSKRILPHPVVARAVSGKKCYVLQDLLRSVTAPEFQLPDVESDVVVFGIVASKTDPRAHKPVLDANGNVKPQPDRGKYMVLTLFDLTYDVELFLFKTGFERYWKLTTGTVVAILNPTIMPPIKGREDTGRWGLVINSDSDTILELGTARDLGYCAAKKADGQLCKTWLNARRTEYCEFHTNEAIRRARAGRNEVNMTSLGGPGGGGGRRGGLWARGQLRGAAAEQILPAFKPKPFEYSREAHSRFYISGGGGSASAAALLDHDGSVADQAERRDATRRRLAAREKEGDLQRRLGRLGAGAGRDYMRHAHALGSSTTSSTTSTATASSAALAPGGVPRPADAHSLGLTRPSGLDIRLSPRGKRKRLGSSHSSSNAGAGAGASAAAAAGRKSGLGWGGTLQGKLSRMRDGEKLGRAGAGAGAGTGERSPVRKKTRFVTDKGIREAGRESLGDELAAAAAAAGAGGKKRPGVAALEVEDEDELVIV